ncbi:MULTISPECIES: amidohydrolase family protein [Streptacidiphilus]|uniref:Amidohydrolase family protein n=1 Tax=Streptacidiphilus cavernicola TaxID=3342716 RepID=A0ABV6UMG2_9ACTN|nr:amidohydrolase family protein [Streptacidiphilus jeojiense]
MSGLLIRRAEVGGVLYDVRVGEGRVLEIGHALLRQGPDEQVTDGRGGALLPGLTDHHIHLFATAADLASTPCDPTTARDATELRDLLHRAGPDEHGWIRGVRYHESVAGELDAAALDLLRDDVPIRIQHRSGALWMLNSLAATAIGLDRVDHPGIERDPEGEATGRLWRADDWLRDRLPRGRPPSLTALGRLLAGYGITSVTDASPALDSGTVDAITTAMTDGALPQQVQLLGAPLRGDVRRQPTDRQRVPLAGPWKIVLADSGLPRYDELVEEIDAAHRAGRPVAVHCVTREALVLLLVALEQAGSRPGDRLEHAALVPQELIPTLHRLGLRVVTQPGFLTDRGDDFLLGVPADEHRDLYRCASLLAGSVPLALSSDAPYGPLDPWAVQRAAVSRLTPAGVVAGRRERLDAAQALDGYLSPPQLPGSPTRIVGPGSPADLVLLHTPLREALAHPDAELVRLCLAAGEPASPAA